MAWRPDHLHRPRQFPRVGTLASRQSTSWFVNLHTPLFGLGTDRAQPCPAVASDRASGGALGVRHELGVRSCAS